MEVEQTVQQTNTSTDLQQKNLEVQEQMKQQREQLLAKFKAPIFKNSEEIERKIKHTVDVSEKKQKMKLEQLKQENQIKDDETQFFESYFKMQIGEKRDDEQQAQLQKYTEYHKVTKGGFLAKEFDIEEYASNFNSDIFAPNQVIKHKEEIYGQLAMRASRGEGNTAPLSSQQQNILQNQVLQQIKAKNQLQQQQTLQIQQPYVPLTIQQQQQQIQQQLQARYKAMK